MLVIKDAVKSISSPGSDKLNRPKLTLALKFEASFA